MDMRTLLWAATACALLAAAAAVPFETEPTVLLNPDHAASNGWSGCQDVKGSTTFDCAAIETAAKAIISGTPLEPSKKLGHPGLTMLNFDAITNIADLCMRAIHDNIPGDFVETGIFHAGSTIMMAEVIKYTSTHGVKSAPGHGANRAVWGADSFVGLPPIADSSKDKKADERQAPSLCRGNKLSEQYQRQWDDSLRDNSVKGVLKNFDAMGVGPNAVKFHPIKGWFNESLPAAAAKMDQIAVLRLDGDMYSSTMDGLTNMYPKLAPGGFLIIDDYGWWPQCKLAVDDYFKKLGGPMPTWNFVTGNCAVVWWRKP